MATTDRESFQGGTATLDQVIAYNVRRLREERGWSRGWLAAYLGVGRHYVYDLEGGRADRSQREFKWSDLVGLCAVFQVTLFDLVLPPEGVILSTDPRWIGDKWGELIIAHAAAAAGEEIPNLAFDRAKLGALVFGAPVSPEMVKDLARRVASRLEAQEAVIAEAAERLTQIYIERWEQEHGND